MTTRIAALLAMVIALASPLRGGEVAMDAKELVDRVDRLLRGDSSSGELTMSVVTRNWTRTLSLRVLSEGTEKALIKVTAPAKEAGTATLKAGGDIWNYLPKIDRTIRVPASMMMASWMGSHFTNDDLVKESRLIRDYEIAVSFEGQRDGVPLWELTLTPHADAAVVWGRIVMEVRKEDSMPTWIHYFGDDGARKRTLTFSKYATMGGRLVPTLMRAVPTDKPDESTAIEYTKLEFDLKLPPETFTLAALKH